MLYNSLLKNTSSNILKIMSKSNSKSFSFLLHEYQGQSLLKKYNISTPKVNRKKIIRLKYLN